MAYLWQPWPWGQTSANAVVTISLGSPGTQDGCGSAWLPIHHLDHNILKIFPSQPFVLEFWVLWKPPGCSQYSGTFCRYGMLPGSWTSERGSEGFRLILMCAVVSDHSIQTAWFPQDGGTISSQGRALPGRNEPHCLAPAPLSFQPWLYLLLSFSLGWDHSLSPGSTSSFIPLLFT